MQRKLILSSPLLEITISRLCQELIENHQDFTDSVIIGLQPRGIFFAKRIQEELLSITGKNIPLGQLDATFYRDDFRRREPSSPTLLKYLS
jgi:pyrimidine operon attenuation protein/uracil phosphoribosyltransferase